MLSLTLCLTDLLDRVGGPPLGALVHEVLLQDSKQQLVLSDDLYLAHHELL